MKKKSLTLLVCIIIAISLISCNNTNEATSSPSFAQKQITTEAPTTEATLPVTTTATLEQTEATTQAPTEPETENTLEASSEIITTEAPSQQPVEQMVWISATGSKYHNKPNCGKMNPDTAKKLSKSEAEAQGYEACKKCY